MGTLLGNEGSRAWVEVHGRAKSTCKRDRKVAGRRGYAGLVPNAMGLIPELTNAGLRAEAEAWEQGLPPPANAHGKTKAKTKPEVDAWEEDGEARGRGGVGGGGCTEGGGGRVQGRGGAVKLNSHIVI